MAIDSNRGSYGKSSGGRKAVSSGRLLQKSGTGNSFGGYTKVNRGDGTLFMKKTSRGK